MKIAINSLPRCGTKILQANFHRYLISTGRKVLCAKNFDGILEPFNFTDTEIYLRSTRTGISSIDDYKIHFLREYEFAIPLADEIRKRFLFLLNLDQSWVYKRTPHSKWDPILYESAVRLDKSVSIKRTNTFEHCISFTVAHYLNIWTTGTDLEKAINRHVTEKIKLDTILFKRFYQWFTNVNKIKWVKDIQVVDFNEMVKVSNSTEFCEFFHIPYSEFDFHPFIVEYGDNKMNMVSNLEELREIATAIDNT